jgi:hypothetical protein
MANIKTIDIEAKEWFDKVNGNSYFSAIVIINFSLKDEKRIILPFQYGYGNHYETVTLNALIDKKIIKKGVNSLWSYCRDNKIILRTSKQVGLRKKDL